MEKHKQIGIEPGRPVHEAWSHQFADPQRVDPKIRADSQGRGEPMRESFRGHNFTQIFHTWILRFLGAIFRSDFFGNGGGFGPSWPCFFESGSAGTQIRPTLAGKIISPPCLSPPLGLLFLVFFSVLNISGTATRPVFAEAISRPGRFPRRFPALFHPAML